QEVISPESAECRMARMPVRSGRTTRLQEEIEATVVGQPITESSSSALSGAAVTNVEARRSHCAAVQCSHAHQVSTGATVATRGGENKDPQTSQEEICGQVSSARAGSAEDGAQGQHADGPDDRGRRQGDDPGQSDR